MDLEFIINNTRQVREIMPIKNPNKKTEPWLFLSFQSYKLSVFCMFFTGHYVMVGCYFMRQSWVRMCGKTEVLEFISFGMKRPCFFKNLKKERNIEVFNANKSRFYTRFGCYFQMKAWFGIGELECHLLHCMKI